MQCYRPIVFNDLLLPCGKCLACKVNKRQTYLDRLDSVSQRGVFFTLTYDEESVPRINGRSRFVYRLAGDIKFFDDLVGEKPLEYGINVPSTSSMVLLKKDIVDFVKRLRKYIFQNLCNNDSRLFTQTNFKYFVCGEYSPKLRPHYHGLIFIDSPEAYQPKYYKYRWLQWSAPSIAEWISACWPFSGQHRITRYVSECSNSSAGKYCLKYVTKHSLHFDNSFFRPFSKFSRGLGFDSWSVRIFYQVIFEGFGDYATLLASESADTFNTPSYLRTFLAKPYALSRSSDSSVIARVESVLRKEVQVEDIHSDDLNFIRSWKRCRQFYLPCVSLAYFLTIVRNFYYKKQMFTLKNFYLNYDVKEYKITFYRLISLPQSNKVRNEILRLQHHLNLDASDFNKLVTDYAIENHKKISLAYQTAFKKLYPFEK